eukprot:comp12731_c0_seq1/m.7846 comp12731_c0_seq1/g.7846  ORF comp12731_c0_seq1/g.7846 comp12731_c0_seq1/m.7846 type:complete len:256 (-) comp12731_c0_seq1:137-904(-)
MPELGTSVQRSSTPGKKGPVGQVSSGMVEFDSAQFMDEDELRELTLSISKLPDSELEQVKTIIASLQPSYTGPGIDLNVLSLDTLLQVQQYVRTSVIEHGPLRILVTDTPKDANLHYYLQTYQKYNVTDVVRTCDAEYQTGPLLAAGMHFHDWRFDDGDVPSNEIVDKWLNLISEVYVKSKDKGLVAVHCAAGLGRAPFLVALALVQVGGMDNCAAVSLIRENRRGAINKKQLDYILKFKARKKSLLKKMLTFKK